MRTTNRLEMLASSMALATQTLNQVVKNAASVSPLALGVAALTISGITSVEAKVLPLSQSLPTTSALPNLPISGFSFAPSLTGNPASSQVAFTLESQSGLASSASAIGLDNFSGFSSFNTSTSDLSFASFQTSGISVISFALQSLDVGFEAAVEPTYSGLTAFKVVDLRKGTGNRYEDLTLDLADIPEFAVPGYQAVGGSVYEDLMAETQEALQNKTEEAVTTAPIALAPQSAATQPLPIIDRTVLPQAPVTRSQAVSIGRSDQRIRLSRTVTLPRSLPGTSSPVALANSPRTSAIPQSVPTTSASPTAALPPTSTTSPTPVSLIARQSTTPNLPNIELPPLQQSDRYLPNSITTQFIWPAQGIFTSGFGPRWGRMHRGIDIAAPVGTPVIASAPGVVTYAGWNDGGFGNLVEIRHSDGTVTLYAHNNRVRVREGQYVRQGELVADMGSTGRSTGPHVHFEIRPLGRGAVNPMLFLTRG